MTSHCYDSLRLILWPPVITMHSRRYETHYSLLLWHPVDTTPTTAYCYDIQSLRHSLRFIAMTSSRYDTHYGLFLRHPVVMTHYGLLLWHPVVKTLTTFFCYAIQSLRHSLRLIAMTSRRYDSLRFLLCHPVVMTLTTVYCYDIQSLWLTTAYNYDIQSLRHPLRLTAMTSSH